MGGVATASYFSIFKDLDEVVYAVNSRLKSITHFYYEDDLILLQIDLPDLKKEKEVSV